MKKFILLTKVVVSLLYTSIASADILFEGYYKLTQATQHIGYFIQRYELDTTSKTFSTTYYLFTKAGDATVIESLSAKATAKLEPISYQYSRSEGNVTKAIDALVKKVGKNSKLIVKIIEHGKPKIQEVQLGEDVFLSAFLAHVILKNPKGLAVGNKFTYNAIAEEDGRIERGEVFVKEQVKERGLDTFRTLNTYKKEEFINWLDIKGESIRTSVPQLNLNAELVLNPKEAYAGLPFSESIIKTLFGNIPAGTKNLLHGQ